MINYGRLRDVACIVPRRRARSGLPAAQMEHQFQFVGYYAALEQGYYRHAGLDVSIREGGPDIDVAETVASGKAYFGVCSASVLREWTMGRRLVVLAAIFQRSPAVIWSKLPHFPAPESKGKGETEWVNPETFFDQLPAVMKSVPPLCAGRSGRGPEDQADPEGNRRHSRARTDRPFFQWHYNGRPAGNGWNSPVNNAQWGTDYLNRTATAKSNMYDNRPEETKYIYRDTDSQGKQLNGQNSYAITFAKGQVPPVRGFWSLTLYNDLHLFNPNTLKRYSLGTKNNPSGHGCPERKE